jgi:general secretion pathway protein H
LELLVVIAIMALATAGVSLAMRDSSQTALERDAQRLAVLFESARAQSRASGVAVVWRTTEQGFAFDGVAGNALPTAWLTSGTTARAVSGAAALVALGPEPIIGPQAIDVLSAALPGDAGAGQVLRVATDGLRPFAVQAATP